MANQTWIPGPYAVHNSQGLGAHAYRKFQDL